MANEIKVLDGDGNTKYYNVLKTGVTGNSFLPIPADLYLAIKLGKVPGYSIENKFGRNPATANASWQGVLQMAAQFYFPTSATTVRVKAGGHANDTAAGIGAQAVTVVGLDDTGALASESIELAGASVSASTSTSFWRIFRAYITPLRAGAYGGALPTTAIMIEDTAGANDMITILAGEGQTQYGAYSIPLATTGYLLSINFSSESSKATNFRMMTRASLTDYTTPFAPILLKSTFDGVASLESFKQRSPTLTLTALTDIWFEAWGDGAISKASVEFEILLIDD